MSHHWPPAPSQALLEPRPGPSPSPNRLLGLLVAYQADPTSLPLEQAVEIETRLKVLSGRLELAFAEAHFIDSEMVSLVFMGKPGGLVSLPTRANLLVDQEWNVSGGIMFSGLHAEALSL